MSCIRLKGGRFTAPFKIYHDDANFNKCEICFLKDKVKKSTNFDQIKER